MVAVPNSIGGGANGRGANAHMEPKLEDAALGAGVGVLSGHQAGASGAFVAKSGVRPTALLWVESRSGDGRHFRKASEAANALSARGYQVVMAGSPATIEKASLYPVADGVVLAPLSDHGAGAAYAEAAELRQQQLATLFFHYKPSVIMTEHFPFGKLHYAEELMPFLHMVRQFSPEATIHSLAVDMATAGGFPPERMGEIASYMEAYDSVLVHGDPAFATLSDTFDVQPYADKIHYAGFLTPQVQEHHPMPDEAREVIVTTGWDYTEVADRLVRAAVELRAVSPLSDHKWRVLVSPQCDEETLAEYQGIAWAHGQGKIIVERNRSDINALLADAAFSLSLGDYNGLESILLAGSSRGQILPALVFPTDKLGDPVPEQATRVARLAELGFVQAMDAKTLDAPAEIAAAMADRLQQVAHVAQEPFYQQYLSDGANQMADRIAGGLVDSARDSERVTADVILPATVVEETPQAYVS